MSLITTPRPFPFQIVLLNIDLDSQFPSLNALLLHCFCIIFMEPAPSLCRPLRTHNTLLLCTFLLTSFLAASMYRSVVMDA